MLHSTPIDNEPSIVPTPGSVFADKYRIDRLLGRGSMGEVYAATHLYTNRQVAIKVLNSTLTGSPGAIERMLREARLTGRIRHESIVDIYDVGVMEGKVFLVMEYLQGEPLTSWLRSDPTPTVKDIIEALLKVMEGVAAAHKAGIIHRDLKPDNIFICYDEEGQRIGSKVLDFGVSKLMHQGVDFGDTKITQTGVMVGTPCYMAPEQIRDSRLVDHRADIYAIGIILFEALAGRIPFNARFFGDLLVEIMKKGIPSLAVYRKDLPSGLVKVVSKAVSIRPEDRFPSIQSFIDAIIALSDVLGLETPAEVTQIVVTKAEKGLRSKRFPRISLLSIVSNIWHRFGIGALIVFAALIVLSLIAFNKFRDRNEGIYTTTLAPEPPTTPADKESSLRESPSSPKEIVSEKGAGKALKGVSESSDKSIKREGAKPVSVDKAKKDDPGSSTPTAVSTQREAKVKKTPPKPNTAVSPPTAAKVKKHPPKPIRSTDKKVQQKRLPSKQKKSERSGGDNTPRFGRTGVQMTTDDF